jgi:hypothetical protein
MTALDTYACCCVCTAQQCADGECHHTCCCVDPREQTPAAEPDTTITGCLRTCICHRQDPYAPCCKQCKGKFVPTLAEQAATILSPTDRDLAGEIAAYLASLDDDALGRLTDTLAGAA